MMIVLVLYFIIAPPNPGQLPQLLLAGGLPAPGLTILLAIAAIGLLLCGQGSEPGLSQLRHT